MGTCPTQCPQAPSGGSRETGQTRCCVVAEAAGRDCAGGGGGQFWVFRGQRAHRVCRCGGGIQVCSSGRVRSRHPGTWWSSEPGLWAGSPGRASRAEPQPEHCAAGGGGGCSRGVRSCVGPPEVRTHAGATQGQRGGQWLWAVNFLGEHQGGDCTWHEAGGKRW